MFIYSKNTPPPHQNKALKSIGYGRSMIEMLGVIAIIGVLSIGGLFAYRQAMAKYRTSEVLNLINQARFVMQELCPERTDTCPFFTDLTEAERHQTLCGLLGPLCPGMKNGILITSIPRASWSIYRIPTEPFNRYRIILNEIPKEVCAELGAHAISGQRDLIIHKAASAGYFHFLKDVNATTWGDKATDIKNACYNNYNGIMISQFDLY